MSKISLVLLSLAALVMLTASPVNAMDLQERLEKRQNIIDQRKEKLQDKKEEVQQNRQQARSALSQKHADNLDRTFKNHEERLNKMMSKIQDKVNLIASKGKDMTAVNAKLAEAKARLAQATELGNKAVAAFAAITPDTVEKQKVAASEARKLAADTREAFKDTLKLMVESIQLLKEVK